MSAGRRSRKAAMKYVPGVESGGSKAFICRIISDGFMSPISFSSFSVYFHKTIYV